MSDVPVSAREAEVLSLVAERRTNAEIARRLHISVRTVENHLSSLLRKYRVADRRELAEAALGAADAAAPGWTEPPEQLTDFVGRSHERDNVLAHLDESRLVTLVGPGGVGKTRLASVVARDAGSRALRGAAFINLLPAQPDSVVQAVAKAVGVAPSPHGDLFDTVAARLRGGDALLVFDNCEHLLESAAAVIRRLLEICPRITVLATSRERLAIAGEQLVTILPLPLASDAEALFYNRARAADPYFEVEPAVVAEICARLDGMPLAIELAAARCGSIDPKDMLRALDDHLRMLVGGRDQDHRHRSMRAVIDWSYQLLAADEQALFRRLGAFAGGFDLDAAADVGFDGLTAETTDVLGRLVDKSLVVRQRGTPRQFRLLETIRAFAREKLDAGDDAQTTLGRHVRWAAATAERLRADGRASWQEEFDAVVDDLRLALTHTPEAPDDTAHRLARALAELTYARRYVRESVEHYRDAAVRASTPAEAAADLRAAAGGVFAFGHAGEAYELLLACAARAHDAGDGTAEAIALAEAVTMAARMPSGFTTEPPHSELVALLDKAIAVGDGADRLVMAHLAAARAWTRSPEKLDPDPDLAKRAARAADATGEAVLMSAIRDALSAIAIANGQIRKAHQIAQRRLAILQELDRNDPRSAAEALDIFLCATSCAIAAGDVPRALSVGRMILDDDVIGKHPYRATSRLVPALVLAGDFAAAIRHADEMWQGWNDVGRPAAAWMSPGVASVALAHGLQHDLYGYEEWRERAASAAGGVTSGGYARNTAAFVAFVDARIGVEVLTSAADADVGQDSVLNHPVEIVRRSFGEFPTAWHVAYAKAAAAELAVVAELPDAAELVEQAAMIARENEWAAACVTRAQARLRHDSALFESSVNAWERLGAVAEAEATESLL